jgi:hypothetical protein
MRKTGRNSCALGDSGGDYIYEPSYDDVLKQDERNPREGVK